MSFRHAFMYPIDAIEAVLEVAADTSEDVMVLEPEEVRVLFEARDRLEGLSRHLSRVLAEAEEGRPSVPRTYERVDSSAHPVILRLAARAKRISESVARIVRRGFTVN